MPIPNIKRFASGDRLYVQSQQIWLILVAFVMEGNHSTTLGSKTVTYGQIAKKMGYPTTQAGHMLSRQLGVIGHFCVHNDIPPLNVIVVNQATSLPGDDVVLRPNRSVKEEQKAVLAEDWFRLRVPTTGTFRQVWEAISGKGDELASD